MFLFFVRENLGSGKENAKLHWWTGSESKSALLVRSRITKKPQNPKLYTVNSTGLVLYCKHGYILNIMGFLLPETFKNAWCRFMDKVV